MWKFPDSVIFEAAAVTRREEYDAPTPPAALPPKPTKEPALFVRLEPELKDRFLRVLDVFGHTSFAGWARTVLVAELDRMEEELDFRQTERTARRAALGQTGRTTKSSAPPSDP